jgi:tetratricopeptide (TPR) repeat protein
MIDIKKLLEKAHGFFVAQKYDKALFLYSQVSSINPTNLEYQIYALLCDISSENSQRAQSLFDYFLVQKDENFEKAIQYVQDNINAFDGNRETLVKIIQDITLQTIETLEAIDYKDFLELEDARGSFKRAYEDIMFSTKIAIQSKENLLDFINKLIENGFDTTAYTYLDIFNGIFVYDEELTKLYEKLESKNIDNLCK